MKRSGLELRTAEYKRPPAAERSNRRPGAHPLFPSPNRRQTHDKQTTSLSKKPGHDHGPHFPNREILVTAELTKAIDEALAARELIKLSVLKNCADDPRVIGELIAERTRSSLVQVIGRKIVLYREGKDDKKKILLPQ